jgi:hypothetical protein
MSIEKAIGARRTSDMSGTCVTFVKAGPPEQVSDKTYVVSSKSLIISLLFVVHTPDLIMSGMWPLQKLDLVLKLLSFWQWHEKGNKSVPHSLPRS